MLPKKIIAEENEKKKLKESDEEAKIIVEKAPMHNTVNMYISFGMFLLKAADWESRNNEDKESFITNILKRRRGKICEYIFGRLLTIIFFVFQEFVTYFNRWQTRKFCVCVCQWILLKEIILRHIFLHSFHSKWRETTRRF